MGGVDQRPAPEPSKAIVLSMVGTNVKLRCACGELMESKRFIWEKACWRCGAKLLVSEMADAFMAQDKELREPKAESRKKPRKSPTKTVQKSAPLPLYLKEKYGPHIAKIRQAAAKFSPIPKTPRAPRWVGDEKQLPLL